MSCKIRRIETDRQIDDYPELPAAWEEAEPDERSYGVEAVWEHSDTGLRVKIKRQRRPTQMHTPETSTDDTGWEAAATDGDAREQLTHDLASRKIAYNRAYVLMLNDPEGEFEPERRDPFRAPREPEEWF